MSQTASSQSSSGDSRDKSFRYKTVCDLESGNNYEVIPGKQAGSKLIVSGDFCYKVNKPGRKDKNGKVPYYLKCRYPSCKATACIPAGSHYLGITNGSEHTCTNDGASSEQWQAKAVYEKMKKRAGLESSSYEAIWTEEIARAPGAAAALDKEKCKRGMQHARNQNIPACPEDIAKAVKMLADKTVPSQIHELYLDHVTWTEKKTTKNGAEKIIQHFGIILGSKELLERAMQHSDFVFADATFKVTPRQARNVSARGAQVLNLVVDYLGRTVSVLTVVMTCRRFPLYRKVFRQIRTIFPTFIPRFIMADYEPSMRKAFKKVFFESRLLGCRFHYSKALYAKLKGRYGLAPYFRGSKRDVNRQRLSELLRMLFALPLLKPEHMRAAVESVGQHLKVITKEFAREVAKKVNKFYNYLIKFWMKLIGGKTISVYKVQHKTNNVAESFNKRMNDQLPQHPSLFRFISALKQFIVTDGIATVAAGEAGQLKSRRVGNGEKARIALLLNSQKLEEDYEAGKVSPLVVLLTAAAHYDEDRIANFFASLQINENSDRPEEYARADDSDAEEEEQSRVLPDIEDQLLDEDERDRCLRLDPELSDVEEDEWEVELWPHARNDTEIATNILGQNENINEVSTVICGVCIQEKERLVVFENCDHLCCADCLTKLQRMGTAYNPPKCFICRAPLGMGPGKVVNVSTIMISRKKEASTGWGLDQARADVAAANRRPAEALAGSDLEEARQVLAERRDVEISGRNANVPAQPQPRPGGSQTLPRRRLIVDSSDEDNDVVDDVIDRELRDIPSTSRGRGRGRNRPPLSLSRRRTPLQQTVPATGGIRTYSRRENLSPDRIREMVSGIGDIFDVDVNDLVDSD